MLTIEELIITSLYHKMVVVNVHRSGASGHRNASRIDGISLLLSCAQRISAAMANRDQQVNKSVSYDNRHRDRSMKYDTANHLASPVTSTTITSDSGSQTDDRNLKKRRRRRKARRKKRNQCITALSSVSDNMETVLDTGELKLMRGDSFEQPASWYFGLDLLPSTDSVVSKNRDLPVVEQPDVSAIDLNKHTEFSVIHYQDLRDPEATSIVMITTPESKTKRISEFCEAHAEPNEEELCLTIKEPSVGQQSQIQLNQTIIKEIHTDENLGAETPHQIKTIEHQSGIQSEIITPTEATQLFACAEAVSTYCPSHVSSTANVHELHQCSNSPATAVAANTENICHEREVKDRKFVEMDPAVGIAKQMHKDSSSDQPIMTYRVFQIDDEGETKEPNIVLAVDEHGYLPTSSPTNDLPLYEDHLQRDILLPTPVIESKCIVDCEEHLHPTDAQQLDEAICTAEHNLSDDLKCRTDTSIIIVPEITDELTKNSRSFDYSELQSHQDEEISLESNLHNNFEHSRCVAGSDDILSPSNSSNHPAVNYGVQPDEPNNGSASHGGPNISMVEEKLYPDMGLNALRGWTSSEQVNSILDSGVVHGRKSLTIYKNNGTTTVQTQSHYDKDATRVQMRKTPGRSKKPYVPSGLIPEIDYSLDDDINTMALDMSSKARSISVVTTLSETGTTITTRNVQQSPETAIITRIVQQSPAVTQQEPVTPKCNKELSRSMENDTPGARQKKWHSNMKYRGPSPRLAMTMSYPGVDRRSPNEGRYRHTKSQAELKRETYPGVTRRVGLRHGSVPLGGESDQSDYESVGDQTPSSDFGSSIGNLLELSLTDTESELSMGDFEKYPDWMSRMPQRLCSVPFSQLAIPGSHMALAIDQHMRVDMNFSRCDLELAKFLQCLPQIRVLDNFRDLVKAVWKLWMPRQMLNIAQQLQAGVRYFDMNVTKFNGAFYGEHSLYTKPLRHYLRQMVNFLDQHRREIVILHFASFSQLDHKEKRSLLTVLYQFFGARLCRAAGISQLTLTELWRNNKQIVLIFPDSDIEHLKNHIFGGLVWSDKIIRSSQPVKQFTEDLLLYLHCIYDEQRMYDSLHVLTACITPNLKAVFCGEHQYNSLRDMVTIDVNAALSDWLADHHNLNIVCIDFVGCHNITGTIIQLNDRKKAESVV